METPADLRPVRIQMDFRQKTRLRPIKLIYVCGNYSKFDLCKHASLNGTWGHSEECIRIIFGGPG